MHLATPLPGWALVAIATAIVAIAVFAYRHVGTLSASRRGLLIGLRVVALALIVLCLLRPMVPVSPAEHDAGVVAVLVDQSRSMGLRDANGLSRLERAATLIRQELTPSLSARWRVETWLFGDELRNARDVALAPTADRSDLAGAVTTAVERLRGRGLAGLIVLVGRRANRSRRSRGGRRAGRCADRDRRHRSGRWRRSGRAERDSHRIAPRCQLARSHDRCGIAAAPGSGRRSPASGRPCRRTANDRFRAGQTYPDVLHRRAWTSGADGLQRRHLAKGRRADRGQQSRVCARASSWPPPAHPGAPGGAGVRAHVSDARVG